MALAEINALCPKRARKKGTFLAYAFLGISMAFTRAWVVHQMLG